MSPTCTDDAGWKVTFFHKGLVVVMSCLLVRGGNYTVLDLASPRHVGGNVECLLVGRGSLNDDALWVDDVECFVVAHK